MKETGKNIAICVLVVGFLACSQTVAFAGTLLSGYGGPGQGSQAVLGAALLGGSHKGSGGSSNGSSSSDSTGSGAAAEGGGRGSSSEGSAGTASEGTGQRNSSSAGQASGTAGASHPTSAKHKRRGTAGSRAPAPSPAPRGSASQRSFSGYTAAQRASAGSPLGISGEDLLYVIVVLGALAFTGVLTGRMASTRSHGGAKGSRGAA